MAYVPSNPDDDEEQRRASASNAPGSFGDTTPTSTPTKTNFVNVSDYLDKNPNASEHLGDLATSKLTSQRDEARGAVDSAKTGFGQQVQAGSQTLDNDFLSGAFSNPETFVKDPGNMARFQALKDASYKGPSNVQSSDVFAPTQSKVTALKQAGEGLGTEAGRTALVGGLSTNPTHGKSALNQLLLQGNSAAAQKISNTASTFGDVDSQWQQFLQDAPGQVSQAQSNTTAARDATRSGLDQATSQFQNQLQGQLSSATNQRNAFNSDYQGIEQAIAGGGTGLTQDQLTKLGIADAFPHIQKFSEFNRGLGYYNSPVQLSQYMSGGQLNTRVPTMQSVATPEQYARESALQQMAGYDLGLPDQQQEAGYNPMGSLPTLNYMDAFNKAGSTLQQADNTFMGGGNWIKDAQGNYTGGYQQGPTAPSADHNQLLEVRGRQTTPGYYTDPSVGAAPMSSGYVDPPQEGAPYPEPTSPNPYGGRGMWDQQAGRWYQIGLV